MKRDKDYPEFKDKSPLVLSDCLWNPPQARKRKQDVVEVEFDEIWSDMRTKAAGRRVFFYKAYNVTKHHEYAVELFEGVRSEPCARCTCPSATPCKHVKTALKELLRREPTFGAGGAGSEFMVSIWEELMEEGP